MTERKPPTYKWHPDQDRSTAGPRIPIGGHRDAPWRRHEFAEGVYLGVNDSAIHLPPRPHRPSHFEQRQKEIAAWRAHMRVIHARVWLGIFLLALVLGALLMVAITHG